MYYKCYYCKNIQKYTRFKQKGMCVCCYDQLYANWDTPLLKLIFIKEYPEVRDFLIKYNPK